MDFLLYKKSKYIKINYHGFDFGEGTAYIKFTGVSVNMYFDRLNNMNIHTFYKKARAWSSISFRANEIRNQENIDWDIEGKIYSCPMSIKKIMKQNENLLKKILKQSEEDFKPLLIKMYGC